jgi:hypothetical protein
LRKMLGEHRHLIKSVAGRGYIFLDWGAPEATVPVPVPEESPSSRRSRDDSPAKAIGDDRGIRNACDGTPRPEICRADLAASA